jgi:hypothetical protein
MNYKLVIPLIATLTNDADLKRTMASSLEAVDLMYRARGLAAQAIVREVFSGEIDLNSRYLSFQIGGSTVKYNLLRIRAVAGIQEIPVDRIGKIQYLHEAQGYSRLAEELGILQ